MSGKSEFEAKSSPSQGQHLNAQLRAQAQRIEEVSLNAWPALHHQFYDGWVLRFAKGFTKRANSIVPLYAAPGIEADRGPEQQPDLTSLPEKLATRVRFCENLYARERLQTIFRLTSISPWPTLDQFLRDRGYAPLEPTTVLCRSLANSAFQHQPPSNIELVGLDQWLAIYGQLAEVPESAQRLHGAILRAIQGTCAFAVLYGDNSLIPVACGLGVLDDDYLGLFDVITCAKSRRQGHGNELVRGLLGWGHHNRAHTAYLQVLDSNAPAQSLYAKLDFKALYQYWYMVS